MKPFLLSFRAQVPEAARVVAGRPEAFEGQS
jgi:hypothetical protein